MKASAILHSTIALVATLLLSAAAHAQLFRTYLASDGNDANPCTLSQPCRLLPAALNAVASGGEIWMLDSANYNTATVTISKSVSILAAPGAVGSILAIGAGGPAISIVAGNLKVGLRNLVIAPLPGGSGNNGIDLSGASTLTIENSLIANLPGAGVYVAGTGRIRVANTTIRDNMGFAVWLLNGASAMISGSQLLGNATGGIHAYSDFASITTASVNDSTIAGGGAGVYAYSPGGTGHSRIFVTRTLIEGTDIALRSNDAGGASTVVVSGCTVVNNNYPWSIQGTEAFVRTLGNNHIADNQNAGVGTMVSEALQ